RQFRDPGRSLSWVCRSHARDERPRHETQVGMVDAFAACLNLLDGHLSDTSLLCPPNRVKLILNPLFPIIPSRYNGNEPRHQLFFRHSEVSPSRRPSSSVTFWPTTTRERARRVASRHLGLIFPRHPFAHCAFPVRIVKASKA